ncbi:unnamed protein product, partial [Prorocentrum cordatum]
MARVRKARERLQGGYLPGPSAGAPLPPNGQADDELREAVERFLVSNQVDVSASQALRTAPPEVQRQVLADKPLQGCNNPSAVLMANIRRAMGVGGVCLGPAGGIAPSGGLGPGAAMPMAPAGGLDDAVGQWAAHNGLDASAVGSLRTLPPELQQKVMDMGPVLGRSPSAIVMGRIRQVRANPNAPAIPLSFLGAAGQPAAPPPRGGQPLPPMGQAAPQGQPLPPVGQPPQGQGWLLPRPDGGRGAQPGEGHDGGGGGPGGPCGGSPSGPSSGGFGACGGGFGPCGGSPSGPSGGGFGACGGGFGPCGGGPSGPSGG